MRGRTGNGNGNGNRVEEEGKKSSGGDKGSRHLGGRSSKSAVVALRAKHPDEPLLALVALRAKHPDEPLLALVSRITGEPMVPGMRRVGDARVDLQRQLDTV